MAGALRHAVALTCAVAVVAASALAASTTRSASASEQRVLLIGDSVATAMFWHHQAAAVFERNLDVDWQVAVCRTLTGQSCPFDGQRAETALDLIDAMPSVPGIVVVEMGYNDAAATFAVAVDETVRTLIAKGAQHVLWLTLAATRPPYPQLDEILAQAAVRYPQLELVDWNAYSYGHARWFQNDLVHLTLAGGVAMAHLAHASVAADVARLQVQPAQLPVLHPGRTYRTHLSASGGTAPYLWSVGSGRPPPGIHLLASGLVYGRPTSGATMDFLARVVDVDGVMAWTTVYAQNASS